MKRRDRFWIGHGVKIFRVDTPIRSRTVLGWALGGIKREHPDTSSCPSVHASQVCVSGEGGVLQSYTYLRGAPRNQSSPTTSPSSRRPTCASTCAQPVRNTPISCTHICSAGGGLVSVRCAGGDARATTASTALRSCRERAGEEAARNTWIRRSNQIRPRDFEQAEPGGARPPLNTIRRDHQSLQHDWASRFHQTDNAELICYSSVSRRARFDPRHRQS